VVRVIIYCAFFALAGSLDAAEKKLKVVTTFLPAYCFAANVAGDLAEVENLLPNGVSPHDFQLTPTEMRKIVAADILLVNGLGMETFLDRAIANAGPGTREKIVTLSAGLGPQLIAEKDRRDDESGHDPHIWLDPQLAMHAVTNVLAALQKADARNAAAYAANAGIYLKRLKELDAGLASSLAPVKDAAFITYHNAFGYFARRYSLNISGVVEPVPEVSPSPRELSALHKTIRDQKVKALFTEPGDRTRLATQIAEDAGIKLGELDPLETGEFTARGYEDGMKRNAENLRQTLR
jgi:zinc transport system substrate-binding protein